MLLNCNIPVILKKHLLVLRQILNSSKFKSGRINLCKLSNTICHKRASQDTSSFQQSKRSLSIAFTALNTLHCGWFRLNLDILVSQFTDLPTEPSSLCRLVQFIMLSIIYVNYLNKVRKSWLLGNAWERLNDVNWRQRSWFIDDCELFILLRLCCLTWCITFSTFVFSLIHIC